jgi:hypothetical protein
LTPNNAVSETCEPYEESELSTQLQIQGLPTLVFVGTDTSKPALRTEGMLPAEMVKSIIANEL